MQDYSAIRLAVAEDCCATLLQREFLRIIIDLKCFESAKMSKIGEAAR
jgi:hypothetical protein